MAPHDQPLSSPAAAPRALLGAATLVFWDFDGVIKDSVTVKSIGYHQLFLPYGPDLAARVRRHHEANSGISRYEKIAHYLGWVGESASAERVAELCEQFSQLVMQAVIDAPWVPGVREYLLERCARQPFVLVTATPTAEISAIVAVLGLTHCFKELHGAPTPKAEAIGAGLRRWQCPADRALMVGDAEADWRAANAHGVPFLLRRTALNQSLQQQHRGASFEGLDHE